MAYIISITICCVDIFFLQNLHCPFKMQYDIIGMLSKGKILFLHLKQKDNGFIIDILLRFLNVNEYAKLPKTEPKQKKIKAKNKNKIIILISGEVLLCKLFKVNIIIY